MIAPMLTASLLDDPPVVLRAQAHIPPCADRGGFPDQLAAPG